MGDSPIPSESGFGSPASDVSLEESDVPIIVWDTREGSNSERIGSRNRTVYLETNWEIAQFRVSPAPDQSPASEVRLRKSGFGSPVSLE